MPFMLEKLKDITAETIENCQFLRNLISCFEET